MRRRWCAWWFGLAVLGAGLPAAMAATPIQVMVLGTYHFGNPGLDLSNVRADDVLRPARQAELQEVAERLGRFRPTRVAVEVAADGEPGHSLPGYRAYLAGERRDRRNEIDQIAFRVARAQGHAEVYGIDAEGDFPFDPLVAFAKAHGQEGALNAALDEIKARARAFEAAQANASIGQLLRRLNEPEAIRREHGWYLQMLRLGQGATQPGAALAAAWYARNLAICARLAQVARPGDRLLVVYGAGHSALLRHCVESTPGWQLVEANDHLPR